MPNQKEISIEQSPPDEDEKFDKSFLNDFPQYTNRLGDRRALLAFRREFNLKRYSDLDIFVLEHEGDISAEEVFEKESDVLFFVDKNGKRRALEARGHEAVKKNLSTQSGSERADVMIMLNPNVRISKKLLEKVVPGGWVLCRLNTANTLRARGKYTFKALIEKNGEQASITRRDDPTFWQSAQVDSDESFREATSLKGEDVVTYAEAAAKVKQAKDAGVSHMSENNVFESYSHLIRIAEENSGSGTLARGETRLPLVVIVKGQAVDLGTIDTVLPIKKSEADDEKKIIVMRKNLA